MTIVPGTKVQASMLLGLVALVAGCEKQHIHESDRSLVQEGVASLQDGSLFESFCSFNLANTNGEIGWEELREKLEESLKSEEAFREIDEFGEIGISKNKSGWVVVLLGEQIVQVYSNGKVICFQKKE